MGQSSEMINVIGMSIITTNEAAQHNNTIGKLWDDFAKASLHQKLNHIISPSVFAVYSDYENGYHSKYKITIGFAVDNLNSVPDGLTAIIIPAGHYKTYLAKSSAPADIINTWQEIWALDPEQFPRSFIADYEEYKDGRVMIHIGYK